jgi:hypothetical protein
MSPDTLIVLMDQLRERLTPMIDRAMSPDTLVVLRDQYALFAIGMLVVFAAGLFLWKKLRKIEVELGNLREEVNHLNLIEQRRFLVGLNSSKAHSVPAHPGSSGSTGDANSEASSLAHPLRLAGCRGLTAKGTSAQPQQVGRQQQDKTVALHSD